MDKISQSLVSKITKLQKRFESFLDNDFENKADENSDMPFEPSRDLALVRGLSQGLPDDHIDRAIVVFSRLALLFNAGVLLENNDGEWKAQAYFHKGASHLLKNSAKTVITLPEMTLMSVMKANSTTMLEKMNLQNLDPDQQTSCLLLKASPDFAYILFSGMADLWLKEHIENVRRALISGFAD